MRREWSDHIFYWLTADKSSATKYNPAYRSVLLWVGSNIAPSVGDTTAVSQSEQSGQSRSRVIQMQARSNWSVTMLFGIFIEKSLWDVLKISFYCRRLRLTSRWKEGEGCYKAILNNLPFFIILIPIFKSLFSSFQVIMEIIIIAPVERWWKDEVGC